MLVVCHAPLVDEDYDNVAHRGRARSTFRNEGLPHLGWERRRPYPTDKHHTLGLVFAPSSARVGRRRAVTRWREKETFAGKLDRLSVGSNLMLLALLLFVAGSAPMGHLSAQSLNVNYAEGTAQGFLVLRAPEGNRLAVGDLTQTIHSDRVVANLIFHFRDGSVDDETTIFSQRGVFRLLSYHHVQKGPSFPEPVDISIDVPTGNVTVRTTEHNKEKVVSEHLDLPQDLANGLLIILLKNLKADRSETKVSYLAATPKPRLVKLAITSQKGETFSAAGAHRLSTRYDVKVELGGLTGVVAPLVGKEPKDTRVWIIGGKAPTFARMEGQLYQGGPLWTIEQVSPVLLKPQPLAPSH